MMPLFQFMPTLFLTRSIRQSLFRWCSGPAQTRQVALPHDASVDDIDIEPGLAFLDAFVATALQGGAAPYIPESQRLSMGVVRPSAASEHDSAHALRFTAYEAPKPASQPVVNVTPAEPASAAGNRPRSAMRMLCSLLLYR